MKANFSVFMFLVFFQLSGQAWPNSLIFTLKPADGIVYRNKTLGFEVIIEKADDIFIGKFKNITQAEVAQNRLADVGVETKMFAFFRTEPINLEDAKILCANMNQQEESTMLSGTSSFKVPEDRIMIDPLRKSKKENDSILKEKSAKSINENNDSIDENAEANSYFTIQLGVFSKSVKHKFKMEVNERVINEKYYCFYGQYFSMVDAKEQLKIIKNEGYSDAFITGIDQGNKVDPNIIKNKIESL
jgi:hypothetical protein